MIQSVNPTPTDETDGLPMPRRIWAVISVGFALCMSVLDVNIINIVLPTLSHDFGTSPAVTTWIINGYQLAIVVSLLSFSALGEIIGYRKVYLSGIGLFCITSLICALSDSFWTLTIARIFQGFSASAITSVNTAQLRYIYPKSQLGRGMGINAMVVAISAAAGPSVASGILSIASWHWLFAINVPLGITALVLGMKHLPRQEERTKRKFDTISAIANAITFGLLIYTLDGFAHHEKMDFLFIQLIVLVVVGTYYVRRQLSQTTPLLPLDLLRIPIFRLSILTSICSFIAQMSAMVSLPFFLQNTLGHSEVMTGLLLTPWPLATLVTAPLAGTDSSGNIRKRRYGAVCRGAFLPVRPDCRVLRYQLNPTADAMWCRFRAFSDTEQQYNYFFCSDETFGRSKRNAGYGTPVGTDIGNYARRITFQFRYSRSA